ncbi:HPr family phosphocarrier protein [Halalkalibacter alkalisediminis]|uniref:HPr family phosphocarrier protein n=1 Tax=Halalkalibacter alkalisediminis TaxID=935616 RepID=A0ABV6NC31_9BACI|nr:HPr family phosphocarrier protein [Halalkalibacter alkalisediminis]
MELTTHCLLSDNLNRDKVFQLVNVANKFDSHILIELNRRKFNAKSLLSVGVLHGANGMISFHANGDDSETALTELKKVCIES